MVGDIEQRELAKILPSIPGAYALQVGGATGQDLLEKSRIRHKYYATDCVPMSVGRQSLQVDPYLMPFDSESLNLVVLSHVLEYAENPRLVLLEAYRLLRPGGQMILMGFNRSSLWLFSQWQRRAEGYPWSGRFLSLWQLKHWSMRMGYGIVLDKSLCFLPPRDDAWSDQWLRITEAMGQTCCPRLGAIYFIYAQKKVTGMTPLAASWALSSSPANKIYVKPTTRSSLLK